jgi:hypothetical protein
MPISATLEELNTRIHELERQLVAAKTERNNLLPVHRLPPEIVVEVFKLIQHGCGTFDETRPWHTFDDGWLNVMLVCRRFREVAVQTSALWNMVDYDTYPPDQIQLFLERARNQPLCIRDSGGGSTELFHRAWSLEINSFAVSTQALNLLQPTLHALHISILKFDQQNAFCFTQSDLHEHLALAYLSLSHLSVQDIPVMHSLHRLELDSVIICTGLGGLMQMLHQVPSVQILCLRNLDLTSDDIERSELVSLPCLHSLLVIDTPKAVRCYLHMLPQPTLALGIYVRYVVFEETRDIPLHSDILDKWVKFARNTRDPALLAHGILKKGAYMQCVEYSLGTGNMVRYLREFGSASASSFCSFICYGTVKHPADPYIQTLHIQCSPTFSHPYKVEELSFARMLPNLQCMVLEGFRDRDGHQRVMAAITACITEQGTRIQQLRFVECCYGMKVPAHKLQEEGFVTTVDWVHSDAISE